MQCIDSLCTEGQANGSPPEIHAVTGTGTDDGSGPRLVERLVVTGANLLGAEAALTGPGAASTSIPLDSCAAATATEMQLALPAGLVDDQYTLTITNAAGSACTGVSFLKGEDGVDGVDGVDGQNGTLVDADPVYVNVDGDVMTGDLSVSGNVAIQTSASAASLAVGATVSKRLTGLFTATGADNEIAGVDSLLTSEVEVGDTVAINGGTYTVTAIASDTAMSVDPQPSAFLNNEAYVGGPALDLVDVAGDSKITVDRRGRLGLGTPAPATALEVVGDVTLNGALACSGCVDSAGVSDGSIVNADIAAGAAIAASKINRTGLNADLVDGRQPTIPIYTCSGSCVPSGWASQCPCMITSTVSASRTVPCVGHKTYNGAAGSCENFAASTCSCNTLLGYVMSP
jgi:hypothetical protein